MGRKSVSGKRILVVDDEPDIRELIEMYSSEKKVDCYSANDGEEAWDILCKTDIDAVISDMRMDRGSGLNLLKKIRQVNPEKPLFFVMTGFSDDDCQEVLDLGAVKVFTKPIKISEMVDAVLEALE